MNKTELIAAVAERTGVTKKDAERVVSATFDTIAAQLAAFSRSRSGKPAWAATP